MIWLVLVLAAPPIIVVFQVRAARCRLCKTAAASPLVGVVLLLAAGWPLSDLGVPWLVQFALGLAASVVIFDLLPRALSRWLHAGPRCERSAANAEGDRKDDQHPTW